jgi:hypothetical protein
VIEGVPEVIGTHIISSKKLVDNGQININEKPRIFQTKRIHQATSFLPSQLVHQFTYITSTIDVVQFSAVFFNPCNCPRQ